MDGQNKDIIASPSIDAGSSSAPALVIEDYADEIAAFDIPEDKAQEFLQTLWDIMVMSADVEMGFDPVSLICGQNDKPQLSGPFADSVVVKSGKVSNPITNDEKEAQ